MLVDGWAKHGTSVAAARSQLRQFSPRCAATRDHGCRLLGVAGCRAAAAYACNCFGNAREENRVTGSLQVSRAVSHPLKARQSFVELEACVAHHEADSSDRTRPTDVECTHNARVLRNGRGERETL
jgi:hypothetical protein